MLLQFQLGSILPTGSSGGGFLALPCLSRLSTSSRRRRSCVVGIPVAMSVNGNGHSDNHYTLLGVSRFATFDEIKKAYRLLARKWHPDVNKNLQAVEVFKSVRVAYEVLSNKATRIQYDRELKAREEFSSMYSWTELRQKMQGKRYSNQYKNSGNSSFFYTETYEYVRDKASFERRGSFIQVLESAFISLFLMQTVGCRLSLTFSILMALFDAKLDGGYKVAYMIAWCLGGKGGILLTLFLSFASWAFGKTSSGTVAVVLIAMWIGSSLANCCPIPQGFLIRDNDGRLIACNAKRCGKVSALQTEAVALQLGLVEARERGIRRLAVEGDCLAIVNADKGAWATPWEIEMLISDALRLLGSFETVSVSHVFREANRAADRIAHLALDSVSSPWSSDLEFQTLVRKDAIGWW